MTNDQAAIIPDKPYFRIGEVCQIVDVKSHVLRYWETEFTIIRPQRASSKQRLYRRVDVENLLIIKRLLKEEGFTIPGARKFLANQQKKLEAQQQSQEEFDRDGSFLRELKSELEALRKILE